MKTTKYQKLKLHSDYAIDLCNASLKDASALINAPISQLPFVSIKNGLPKTSKHAYQITAEMAGYALHKDFNNVIAHLNHNFKHHSNHVIFPESKEVVDSLMRTVITGNANLSALKKPYESFAFMMPEGYKTPSGRPLKSFIVNWGTHKELSTSFKRFAEYLDPKIKGAHIPSENDERMEIAVTFCCAEMQFAGIVAYIDDIVELFQDTKSNKELNLQEATDRITYEPGASRIAFDDQDEDGLACYDMIKIAIALGIHKSVFGDKVWVDELPKTKAHKGSIPKDTLKIHGLKTNTKTPAPSGKSRDRGELSGHIRGTHFRNLRSERYYQGDYAKLAPESRWVAVSESWVGYEIQPHTVKENKK